MNHLPAPLLAAIRELDELAKSRDDAWQISADEGRMLYQLAMLQQPRVILEIGTSYGFSGLHWAAALLPARGQLHTIDMSQKKYDSSKSTFTKAGVGHLVTNYLGRAQDVLPSVPGPIDIAFIDADKDATQTYFHLLWPKVAVNGSILVDNASTHRKELHDYVHHVRSRPDATSVELPVGNGVEWTIKLG